MKEDDSAFRLREILSKLESGKLEPEECRDELEELLGPGFSGIFSLIEADKVLERMDEGTISLEEADKAFRKLANRHPSVPALFLFCALACSKRKRYEQSFGYMALYQLKKALITEEDGNRYEYLEAAMSPVIQRFEEEPELLEIHPYLGCGDQHLIDHFLVQLLVDCNIRFDDDEVIEMIIDRRSELGPLVASMVKGHLNMIDIGMSDIPAGLDAAIAIAGMSMSLETLPVLLHSMGSCWLEALNEAVLALARLGTRYPEEVSRALRVAAVDLEAGEGRLPAVDALGLLPEVAGNRDFLLQMLGGLNAGDELFDDLFMFLTHALLSSQDREASVAISTALEKKGGSLGEEAALFIRDYLDCFEEIELGPRLQDILDDETENLLLRPLLDLDQEARTTLTLMRDHKKGLEDSLGIQLAIVEEMLKSPRNLPCGCGSGFKFKKCCMPGLRETRDSLLKREKEPPSGFAGLFERLQAFARIPSIREERFDALYEFLNGDERDCFQRDTGRDILPEELIYENWFLFDRLMVKNGRTPAEEMLERQADSLPPDLAGILRAAVKWRFSVYEVQETVPGERMVLRDVFRGGDTEVTEKSGSGAVAKWDLLATHLMEQGDNYIVAGDSYIVPREYLDIVSGFVHRTVKDFQAKGHTSSLDEFLNHYGFLVYQQVVQLYRTREMPTILTAEGDLMAFCEAVYEVSDPTAARNRLTSHPWMEKVEEEPGGTGSAVTFNWLMSREMEDELRKGEHQGPQNRNRAFISSPLKMDEEELAAAEAEGLTMRGFGSLSLEGTKLVFFTQSKERLEVGKQELDSMLAGLAGHRTDSIKDQEAVLSEAFKNRGPEKPPLASGLEGLPPEAVEQLAEKMFNKVYGDWLDVPLPYLDNKTPREAAATPEGRQRVEQLLRDYENKNERRPPGMPSFDFSRFRRELGI